MRFEFWSLLVCAGLLGGAARAEEPRRYTCYRTAGEVVVDGKLTEPTWKRAEWTDLFVDIEGDEKPPPRYATRAMMAWDDQYFYVAAEMEEPDVWGRLTQRDVMIYEDPDFEVFIWPGGNWTCYYEFEINPLNTVLDGVMKKKRGRRTSMDFSWDFKGLRHAVQVSGTLNWAEDVDEGWSVEVAFPWAALEEYAGDQPVPPREGDVWRVNFSRVERVRGSAPTDCDNWVWSPQGEIQMHIPDRWGFVEFTETVAGER